MKSAPLSLDLPKRVSLPAQTAATIRRAIEQGAWKKQLPSERRLCEILRVSRPTVRTALGLLKKDGLLDCGQGRLHRIVTRQRRSPPQRNRFIGLVAQELVSRYSLSDHRVLSELRTQLADHKYATEIFRCRDDDRPQRPSLQDYVRTHHANCWLLMSVSEKVQRWFASQGLPALVMGSCHAEVRLPSFDVDQRSVCRHAAGVFLRHGHRRMALVVPDTGLAGDHASELGFQEGAQLADDPEPAAAVIVRHDGTVEHIHTRLNALFGSDQAPTAVLVAVPRHAMTVLLYLLRRGYRVPGQVSFICREHDPMFDHTIPAVSHYRFEDDAFVNRLTRQMLKLVNQGLAPEPCLIFPKYSPGGTVRPPER